MAIESNSPRISGGASGLGSNVSRWLGPPGQNARMTPRIGGAGLLPATARQRSTSATLKPSQDSPRAQPPATRKPNRGVSCGWALHDDLPWYTLTGTAKGRSAAMSARGSEWICRHAGLGNTMLTNRSPFSTNGDTHDEEDNLDTRAPAVRLGPHCTEKKSR